MAEMTTFAAGTPCWVDLGSADIEASASFYADLFGWRHDPVGDPEQTGGYGMFLLRGKEVAGVGPLQPGQPPSWTTYVCVDDVDATADLVRSNGGHLVAPAMDVMEAGRMAVFADPTGAVLALWQPRAHRGCEIVDEPDTFCWAELDTRDMSAATRFYRAVFGWATDAGTGDDADYVEFRVGGTSVAGAMPMPAQVPAEVPSYWMPYFAVRNADETAALARDRGGRVLVEPTDVSVGRFAVVADVQGAVFGILRSG